MPQSRCAIPEIATSAYLQRQARSVSARNLRQVVTCPTRRSGPGGPLRTRGGRRTHRSGILCDRARHRPRWPRATQLDPRAPGGGVCGVIATTGGTGSPSATSPRGDEQRRRTRGARAGGSDACGRTPRAPHPRQGGHVGAALILNLPGFAGGRSGAPRCGDRCAAPRRGPACRRDHAPLSHREDLAVSPPRRAG